MILKKYSKVLFFALLFCGMNSSVFISASKELNKDQYIVNDNSLLKEEKNLSGAAAEEKVRSAFETVYNLPDGKNVYARFGGKYTNEIFGAARIQTLSDIEMNDRESFVRATADFFVDFSYGEGEYSRIQFHDTLRFRHRWGGHSEISTDKITVSVASVGVSDPKAILSKHVLWTREAWLKVMLGDLQERDDFLQIGLVPFSMGRGIALGSAYRSGGFLGFSPGFSVDQYAPGAVLRYDLFPKNLSFDGYFALLENNHTSLRSNNETIRASELLEGGASKTRGTHSHVYMLGLRSNVKLKNFDETKEAKLEPYFIYQHAPDQEIEFSYDSAAYLKSIGVAFEVRWGKLEIGGEFGANRGHQDVKAWDRNEIIIVNDNGVLTEQFTKIYDDAAKTSDDLATVTTANKTAVDAADRLVSLNGDEIATGAGLWNADDRFRPAQKRRFGGWFAILDSVYKVSSDLEFVVGLGWSSGQLNSNESLGDDLEDSVVLRQTYDGFVPLQSVYSGTRLRHLIMLNSGVVRFGNQKPWETPANSNVVSSFTGSNTISGFTNLAYIGGSLDWKIAAGKKYDIKVTPNVVHYWSPASPTLPSGETASSSLGTELVLELSALIFDRIKLYTYGGVLFPGQQYTQMKDAMSDNDATLNGYRIGDAPAYIVNIGATFSF